MKNIKLNDSESALTNEEFDQFVNEFNLTLPEAYKNFILKSNGGYPELIHFEDDEGNLFEIQCFNCIRLELGDVLDELNLLSNSVRTLDNEKIERNLPEYLYPFGYEY